MYIEFTIMILMKLNVQGLKRKSVTTSVLYNFVIEMFFTTEATHLGPTIMDIISRNFAISLQHPYACIFMDHTGIELLKMQDIKPCFWQRFNDNIFCSDRKWR